MQSPAAKLTGHRVWTAMDKSIISQAPYFDAREVRRELTQMFEPQNGVAQAARPAVLDRLKELLKTARIEANRQLVSDGNGRRCAEGLANFQDELIRLVYDYTRGASLSGHQPVRRRAHGRHRHRRLRARPACSLLRHRSAVPAALQADALGRERRRVHALSAVGPGAEGRSRHAHRRPMPQAVARRRDHPHHAAGCALHPGRRGRCSRS